MHRFDQLRASTVVDLIGRCDGFRKPERIAQLARVCEADKRGRGGNDTADYPQARALLAAHAAAMRVRASDLSPNLTGAAIGEGMRRARIAAVAANRANDVDA